MTEQIDYLNGKRIVVVEDDYLLATDMCRDLRASGAVVLGPAPTPFYAQQLIRRNNIDAAVLDIRLHGTTVFELAAQFQDRGVPIIFVTAYDRSELPARFRQAPLFQKPVLAARLMNELSNLLRRPARAVQPTIAPVARISGQTPVQVFAQALAKHWRHASGGLDSLH